MRKLKSKPELSFILFIPLIIIVILIIVLLIILIKRKKNAVQANNNLQNIPQWQRNILNRNNANNNNNNNNGNANNDNPVENLRGEARLRHAQEIRQRALARAALARGEAVNNIADVRDENGEIIEDAEIQNEEIHVKKIGKKKAEHLRRKEQRQQYNQWVEAQREHKKERERLKQEDARKRKAKELKRIEKEEERMMKIKEKMRQKEELLKKELEKQRQEDEARRQRMISQTPEIISYLEANSPVSIEAVASQFNLRVKETRSYIEELLNNNNIIGIFDTQGKFITIKEDQLLQLKKIIESSEYNGQINNETFIDLCQNILLKNSNNSNINLDEVENSNNIELYDNDNTVRKKDKDNIK
ncbi:hypothetical protein BCR32DRAFT_295117 [Anaeromyces robustus]|uniref:DDRGK domain-containing protein 1 n=1 Tax=Anaeromyces robustus TaxID=1754192 RepID=A0A1Y1WYN2_9FUNG|nr:hypothetical protein BCR32DRAFT_295117 [Anaeromyces robustus]|eukprot:ORX78296.1 hypothetical protein BCR32DRAFT_295117 [Anaeromyces robustus]